MCCKYISHLIYLKHICCLLQCLQEPFVRSLSSYHFHGATSPFDRRITCLEWHPTHPTTLAVGSKGGDLYLWDFETPTKQTFIQGVSVHMTIWLNVTAAQLHAFNYATLLRLLRLRLNCRLCKLVFF